MSKTSAEFETLSYPKATGNFSTQPYCALHLHRHLEFACILSGKVEVTIRGEKRILSGGDSVLIVPYIPHSYTPLEEDSERFVLVFEPEYVGSLGEILLDNQPIDPFIDSNQLKQHFPALRNTLYAMLSSVINADTDALSYAQAFSNLVHFLGKVLSITQLTQSNTSKNKLYLTIISLTNSQYTDPSFDIETVADKLHISSSRIQQLFNEHMSISFKKYITLLRISKAKEMLREPSASINEIAKTSGFNSIRTFNRIFKAHKGISPHEYRKCFNE